jgi:hypothetical protein
MDVIYTAISGGYDTLLPHPPAENTHFVAFVDDPENRPNRGWKLKHLESFCPDPTRNSKRYKVMAHEMFPDAKHSLWVDGNVEIQKDFNLGLLISMYLARNDLALFNHPRRKCPYEEARICSLRRVDDPDVIAQQMSRYRTEGYPENLGLTENRIILRRHTPSIEKLNNVWWAEICNGSRRDQLSLGYSLWKMRITYGMIPGKSGNNQFFRCHEHALPRRRHPQ